MKVNIYGNGAEIVIGKLSEKQTDKIFPLLSKKDDGIDETEFETIMEKPWSEIDNIFHWNGAFGGNYGFYITNEKEEEIKPEGTLNFNFDDDDCFKNNSKNGVDNYHVGINKFNLISKGHWGSFDLKDNFEVKKLVPKIVCPNIGLYHECLYGFLYDGKEVEVEFTGDTVGKTRTFYLIEPTYDDDNGQITYDIADEWYM